MKKKIKTTEYLRLRNFFSQYIQVVGYSTKCGDKYTFGVTEFLGWLEEKGVFDINDINKSALQEYYYFLSTRPKYRGEGTLGQSAIQDHFLSIKILFEYLSSRGMKKTLPFPNFFVSDSEQSRKIATTREVKQILKRCETPFEEMVVVVAYSCGARRSEMVNLNETSYNAQTSTIFIENGKNNKSRHIPLSDKLSNQIRMYIDSKRAERSSRSKQYVFPFFEDKHGERASGDQLCRTFKKVVRRTNNSKLIEKELTLHSMRHSVATHFLENGAGIEFVKEFLGHTDVDTSHLYTKRRRINNKYAI